MRKSLILLCFLSSAPIFAATSYFSRLLRSQGLGQKIYQRYSARFSYSSSNQTRLNKTRFLYPQLTSARCTFTKIRDKAGRNGFSVEGKNPEQYVEIFAGKDPKVRMEANIASATMTLNKEGYVPAQLEQGACKAIVVNER